MNPNKVRVFTLPQNKGIAEALNTGMQVASDGRAQFIARMDSDDICVPQRIETQVNFFLRNPTVDICGSNVMIFNEQSRSAVNCKIIGYPTLDSLIKHNMLFHCCLAHPSVMFRVTSTENRLIYNTDDSSVQAFEDYELWLRLIHSPSPPTFANIGIVLLLLRKHGANVSQGGVSVENEIPMKLNMLTNYYVQGDLKETLCRSPQIVGEFIKVTGRTANSNTFSNLKQKRELSEIFKQVQNGYKLKL